MENRVQAAFRLGPIADRQELAVGLDQAQQFRFHQMIIGDQIRRPQKAFGPHSEQIHGPWPGSNKIDPALPGRHASVSSTLAWRNPWEKSAAYSLDSAKS